MELKLYLSAAEAAQILGLSLETMRRRLRELRDERELPRGAYQDGPFWRIEYDSLGYIAWRIPLSDSVRKDAHKWSQQVWELVHEARARLAAKVAKVPK